MTSFALNIYTLCSCALFCDIIEPRVEEIFAPCRHVIVETGYADTTGQLDDHSPVKIDDITSDKTLVADVAFKDGGRAWGDLSAGVSEWAAGSPAHGKTGEGSDAKPKGGNHVFADGSGRWVDFSEMRELHSWSGRRNWYYFQEDLGDQIPALP